MLTIHMLYNGVSYLTMEKNPADMNNVLIDKIYIYLCHGQQTFSAA